MQLWLTFVAAATIVLMIPGPTVFAVVGFSIAFGRTMTLVLAATVAMAHATMLILLAAGLGVLFEKHPAALNFIQVVGVVYLVYALLSTAARLRNIHIQSSKVGTKSVSHKSKIKAVRQTYLVTLLNPNTFVFFIALLPQFVNPERPVIEQLLFLSITFVALSATNSAIYGLSSVSAVSRVKSVQHNRQFARGRMV